MARVKTPSGEIVETSSPGALAYYQREPGYEVLGDDEDRPRRARSTARPDGSADKGDKQ